MTEETKPFWDKKKIIALLFMFLVIGLMFGHVNAEQSKTITADSGQSQFVLAEWDYPDEYGQGIYDFDVYENSTGSWVNVGGLTEYDESGIFEWNASVGIKLKCWTYFNSTLTGAEDTNDGKNYQQHSVTVTSAGQTIFSQQNFTYSNAYPEEDPMWVYAYDVVLNFLPVSGAIYTVTVTYEVFY